MDKNEKEDSLAKWRRISRQQSSDHSLDVNPRILQAYLDALAFVSDLDYSWDSMKVISGKERIFLYGLRCHIIYGPYKEPKSWSFSSIDRAKREAWKKASDLGKTKEEAMELFISTVENFIHRLPKTPENLKSLSILQRRTRKPLRINCYEDDHISEAIVLICCLKNVEFILNRIEFSPGKTNIPWIDDNSEIIHGRFVTLKYLCFLERDSGMQLYPTECEQQLKIEMYLEWHLSRCYPEDQFTIAVEPIESVWLADKQFIGGLPNPTVADLVCFLKLTQHKRDSNKFDEYSPKIQQYMSTLEERFEHELQISQNFSQNKTKDALIKSTPDEVVRNAFFKSAAL